ncbi:MAG TPA: hypothetical protein VF064_02090 [Pyrinomonadaceae bacterium]
MKDETTVISKRAGAGGARRMGGRLPQLNRGARATGPLGLPEIIALAAAALLLVTAIASYLLLLRPQRTRLQAMNEERALLQKQLQDMESTVGKNQDAQASARTILDSLVGFETEHLGDGGQGSTRVIEELNRLIRKNGLRISGGLAFTQLQETAPGEAQRRQQRGGTGEQSAARVVESVFPGIAVTLTVEGTYPKLRQFIRDVESDRQSFIVVNAVELEGIADSGGPSAAAADAPVVSTGEEMPGAAPRPTAAPSGVRGTVVSLRLEMAAYFRRANVTAPDEQPAPTRPDGPAR